MEYAPYINRNAAQHDVQRAGAAARQVGDRIFLVQRLAPADDLKGFITEVIERRPWVGLRTKGTNPTTWDTGDPETLARLIEMYHDYPEADMLGHYTTEQ